MGECSKCGKKRFKSKKAARNYARSAFPKDRVQVYMCGGYYHFGHGDRYPRRKSRKKV
jgi:hypothetical protein